MRPTPKVYCIELCFQLSWCFSELKLLFGESVTRTLDILSQREGRIIRALGISYQNS